MIKKVITVNGPTKRIVLAEELGIREQHLSDALNGNGKNFDVRWLPGAVRYDREHEVAGVIAAWQDCKVVERAPLSAQQKLDRLRTELRENGADVEALEERAYARGET